MAVELEIDPSAEVNTTENQSAIDLANPGPASKPEVIYCKPEDRETAEKIINSSENQEETQPIADVESQIDASFKVASDKWIQDCQEATKMHGIYIESTKDLMIGLDKEISKTSEELKSLKDQKKGAVERLIQLETRGPEFPPKPTRDAVARLVLAQRRCEMNEFNKERLEKLRERFLRCDSLELYNSACAEGGQLWREMIEQMELPLSDQDAKFWRDYFSEDLDFVQREFQLRQAFQLASHVYCEVPNALNLTREILGDGITGGSMKLEPKVLSEKMAAFCVELMNTPTTQQQQQGSSAKDSTSAEVQSSNASTSQPANESTEWRTIPTINIIDGIERLGEKKRDSIIEAFPTLGDLEDIRGEASKEHVHFAEKLPDGIGKTIADKIEERMMDEIAKYSLDAKTQGIIEEKLEAKTQDDVAEAEYEDVEDDEESEEDDTDIYTEPADEQEPVTSLDDL